MRNDQENREHQGDQGDVFVDYDDFKTDEEFLDYLMERIRASMSKEVSDDSSNSDFSSYDEEKSFLNGVGAHFYPTIVKDWDDVCSHTDDSNEKKYPTLLMKIPRQKYINKKKKIVGLLRRLSVGDKLCDVYVRIWDEQTSDNVSVKFVTSADICRGKAEQKWAIWDRPRLDKVYGILHKVFPRSLHVKLVSI